MSKVLPEFCYYDNNGEVVIIKKGMSGYFATDFKKPVIELNKSLGVTEGQVEAMVVGSMFGWNCTGADPNYYNDDGSVKK